MTDARWIVLSAAAVLALAGVLPLVRRVSAVIAGTTPARRLLDAVWTALPLGFLVALLVWVAIA
jgi:hypothetical protein